MTNIFNQFEVKLVKNSVRRVKMDDATYFGPDYKDYVSNSKLALLNPSQGGSPQKFYEGFKSTSSTAFALGSAIHQLTLEADDYYLSDITAPSGKLGAAYHAFKKHRTNGKNIEEALILACNDADYYLNRLKSYTGTVLPGFIKEGVRKCLNYNKHSNNTKTEDGRLIIYLPSDSIEKCKKCVDSLKHNEKLQKYIRQPLTYFEDVIFCDLEISFPVDFLNPKKGKITEIVKFKMKADNWTINHEDKLLVLNDLKSSGKPLQYFKGYEYEVEGFMGERKKEFKEGSFSIFHYSRQMAMYSWMLREYVKQEFGEGYRMSANMLVVETIGDFNSTVFPVTNAEIQSGFKEFSELVKRVAFHQHHGYSRILELEDPNNLNF